MFEIRAARGYEDPNRGMAAPENVWVVVAWMMWKPESSSVVVIFVISALVSNTLSSRGDPLTALKTCGARLVATHQPEHF